MFEIEQSNTLWFKIQNIDQTNQNTDINTFIELFLENGPLHVYAKYVFGITTLNFHQKIFTVTLNDQSTKQHKKELLEKFQQESVILSPSGHRIKISAKTPTKISTITLHPMPHGINSQILSKITSGWGTLVSFQYGRHKLIPNFRNSFLHIKIKDPNLEAIPERIVVNKHYVSVMKQTETHIQRCGFCKLKGHKANECPETLPGFTPAPEKKKTWATIPNNTEISQMFQKNFPTLTPETHEMNRNKNPNKSSNGLGPKDGAMPASNSGVTSISPKTIACKATISSSPDNDTATKVHPYPSQETHENLDSPKLDKTPIKTNSEKHTSVENTNPPNAELMQIPFPNPSNDSQLTSTPNNETYNSLFSSTLTQESFFPRNKTVEKLKNTELTLDEATEALDILLEATNSSDTLKECPEDPANHISFVADNEKEYSGTIYCLPQVADSSKTFVKAKSHKKKRKTTSPTGVTPPNKSDKNKDRKLASK